MQRISAQNVVDLLLDAVCIVDASSQVVYVSPAFERILGTPLKRLWVSRCSISSTPADRQATEQQANRVMEGSLQLQFENRYIRKDGALVDILWTARWLPDRQLRLAVAHDITRRKRIGSRCTPRCMPFPGGTRSLQLVGFWSAFTTSLLPASTPSGFLWR